MDNPGQSINFDAICVDDDNQLERELEEEKQTENELKNLLSTAFGEEELDNDEDDDMSSSSDFSNASSMQQPPPSNNHDQSLRHHQHGHNPRLMHNNQYSTPAVQQLNQLPPKLSLQQTAIKQHYEDQPTIQYEPPQHQIQYQQPQSPHMNHIDDEPETQYDQHLHLTDDDLLQQNKQPVAQFGNGLQLQIHGNDLLQTPKNQQIVRNYQTDMPPPHHQPLNNDIDSIDIGCIDDDEYEQQMQQNQLLNLEDVNRKFGKLQLLYNARGRKLDEVTSRFEAYQEDISREQRQFKHRIAIYEQENENLRGTNESMNKANVELNNKLLQLNETVIQLRNELDNQMTLSDQQNKKMMQFSDEIENLNYQLEQQQKNDSIEKLKVSNENLLTTIRQSFETEKCNLNEALMKLQFDFDEKTHLCEQLKFQLDNSLKQNEIALLERSETVQRLNKKISDLQRENNDLQAKQPAFALNDGKLAEKCEQLSIKNMELEEQIRLLEAMQNCSAATNDNNSDLNNSGQNTSNESVASLKKELERALNTIKTKRNDIVKYQNEINRLKELNANYTLNSSSNSNNENAKTVKIEQLSKENDELKQDINELNLKLEKYYQNEDNFNNLKENYEVALTQSQYEISTLKIKLNEYESLNINEKLHLIEKSEHEIEDLKLKLNENDGEIVKLQQLYIDVCKEKNLTDDCFRKQIKDLNAELMDIRRANECLMSENESLKRAANERDDLKQSYENDKEKFKNFEMQIDQLKNTQCELNNLKKEHDEAVMDLNEQVNRIKTENGQLKVDHDKIKIERDQVKIEKDKLKADYDQSQQLFANETEKLSFEKEKLQNECNQLQLQLQNAKKENAENLKQRLNNNVDKDLYKKTLDDNKQIQLQLNAEKERYSKLRGDFDTIKLTYDNLRHEHDKLVHSNADLNQLNEKFKLVEIDFGTVKRNYELEQEKLNLEMEKNSKLKCEYDLLKEDYDSLKRNCTNEFNQLKLQHSEYNKKLSKDLEVKLTEELNKLNKVKMGLESQYKIKETELNDELSRAKSDCDNLSKKVNELSKKLDNCKFDLEDKLKKKDEESQRIVDELQMRFETDYTRFIQTYKESLSKSLQEKTNEFNEEKDGIINMYEEKIKDLELNEQYLQKQLKSMKRIQSPRVVAPSASTTSVGVNTNSNDNDATPALLSSRLETPQSERFDLKSSFNNTCLKEEILLLKKRLADMEYENDEYQKHIKLIEGLLEQTDVHMSNEIDKLKYELEQEYREKLEKLQYDHKYEMSRQKDDSINNSSPTYTPPESSTKRSLFFKNSNADKLSKLKNDLQMRDKHIEQLEYTKQKLQQDLEELNENNESQLIKLRFDLDEQYKNIVKNLQSDNDNLQNLTQKLKKTQIDSDSLIKNLKDEINNLKSIHLDEIKTLKLNSERDKQYNEELKEKLVDNEDKHKQELEELTFKYNVELNKMNTKMNEMAKKQKSQNNNNNKAVTFTTSCQTDCTSNDIKLLESMREKYLSTATQMKVDMVKKLDEQSRHTSDKLRREFDAEKQQLIEKLRSIYLKRLIELLRENRVADSRIQIAINELDQELNELIQCQRANNKSPFTITTSSSEKQTPKQMATLKNHIKSFLLPSQSSSSPSLYSAHQANKQHTPVNKSNEFKNGLFNTVDEQNTKNQTQRVKSPDVMKDFHSASLSAFNLRNSGSGLDENRRAMSTTPYNNKESKRHTSDRSTISEIDEDLQKKQQQSQINTNTDVTSTYKYTPLRQSWSNVGQQQYSSPSMELLEQPQQNNEPKRPKSTTSFSTLMTSSTSSASSTITSSNDSRFQTMPRSKEQQTNLKFLAQQQSTSTLKSSNYVTARPASCLTLYETSNGVYSGLNNKRNIISDDLDGDPVRELDSSASTYSSHIMPNGKDHQTQKPTKANSTSKLVRTNENTSKKISNLFKPFNGSSAHETGSSSSVQKIKKIFS